LNLSRQPPSQGERRGVARKPNQRKVVQSSEQGFKTSARWLAGAGHALLAVAGRRALAQGAHRAARAAAFL